MPVRVWYGCSEVSHHVMRVGEASGITHRRLFPAASSLAEVSFLVEHVISASSREGVLVGVVLRVVSKSEQFVLKLVLTCEGLPFILFFESFTLCKSTSKEVLKWPPSR